eukprot:2198799-Pleurochrysis_carterae.AAC.2
MRLPLGPLQEELLRRVLRVQSRTALLAEVVMERKDYTVAIGAFQKSCVKNTLPLSRSARAPTRRALCRIANKHMEVEEEVAVVPEPDAAADLSTSTSGSDTAYIKAGVPQWNPIEVYACVKACLSAMEADQTQPIPIIEHAAQVNYAGFVVRLAEKEGNWSTSNGRIHGWTPEKSAEVRGHPLNAPKVLRKYQKEFKPYIQNVINPTLVKLLNADNSIRSGLSKDELIVELKKKLYDEERTRKETMAERNRMARESSAAATGKKRKSIAPVEPEPGSGGEGAAGTQQAAGSTSKAQQLADAAAEKHQKARDSYDGGPCFLTWLRLGPWSTEPEGAFALFAKDTPPPALGGRQAQREALMAAKSQAKPKEPSADDVYKAAKLKTLEKMGDAHAKVAEVRESQHKQMKRTVTIANLKAKWEAYDKVEEKAQWEAARNAYFDELDRQISEQQNAA